MKRFFFFSFLWVAFCSVAARAQTCMGMTLKTGMGCEMLTYNAKDKLTGKMTYNVTDVRREGGNTLVTVAFESTDDKGKSTQKSTLTYTCSGNELVADLSGFMQNSQNQAFKDGEVRMKTNRLTYSALSAGQTLPDGKLEADMYNNGSLMVEMTLDMTNRTVGNKESLTVPAGTFEVFKVSSDMTVKSKVMGMSIPANLKVVNYRANNTLFDIRSETYNKNGKLYTYTVLNKVY